MAFPGTEVLEVAKRRQADPDWWAKVLATYGPDAKGGDVAAPVDGIDVKG